MTEFWITLPAKHYRQDLGWNCSALSIPGARVVEARTEDASLALTDLIIDTSHVRFAGRSPVTPDDLSIKISLSRKLVRLDLSAIAAAVITAIGAVASSWMTSKALPDDKWCASAIEKLPKGNCIRITSIDASGPVFAQCTSPPNCEGAVGSIGRPKPTKPLPALPASAPVPAGPSCENLTVRRLTDDGRVKAWIENDRRPDQKVVGVSLRREGWEIEVVSCVEVVSQTITWATRRPASPDKNEREGLPNAELARLRSEGYSIQELTVGADARYFLATKPGPR